MFNISQIKADSPDIQDQANQTANTNDNIVWIKIKSFPCYHQGFKKNKTYQQVKEEFFLIKKVEEQNDKRGINKIII